MYRTHKLSRKQCQQLGIEGVKIKSEIIALAKDLPEQYEEIATEAKGLQEAVQLYQDFVQANLDEGVEIKVGHYSRNLFSI